MIAAEQYACRLVVPSSQRFGPNRWPSHKDHAANALAKLAGPHLPATLKQLEKAIAKAHAELHDARETAYAHKRNRPHTSRDDANADRGGDELTTGPVEESGEPAGDRIAGEDDLVDDGSKDPLDDEIVDVAGVLGPDGHERSDADPRL